MEEKIIIKSERYRLNIKMVLYIICALFFVIGFVIYKSGDGYSAYFADEYSVMEVMFDPFSFVSGLFMDIGVIFALISLIVSLWLSSVELTVTDKRVYGKAAFGKRVDLPLDSISAVGTSWLKGIDIGTSSGRIKFKLLKNQKEIHSAMSQLLMERQSSEKKGAAEFVAPASNADELKKYKELLDSGVITQEEFEAKKKQLLGL